MDKYKASISKIQNYLIQNGFDENKIDDTFSPCLDRERLKILSDLYNFFSYWSSVFYEKYSEDPNSIWDLKTKPIAKFKW